MTPARRALCALALSLFSTGIARADATPPSKSKGAPPPGALTWRTDFSAGMADALKQHQRVLMLFCAEWAMACHELRKQAFADPEIVAQVRRRFVPLYVDVTNDEEPQSKALRERYKAATLPTILLFDRNGHEVKRKGSYIDPPELLQLLNAVP